MSEFKLDLDEEPVKPAEQAKTVLAEPSQQKSYWPFIVMAVVAMLSFQLGQSFERDRSPRPDDRRETVEPVDPQPKPDDRKQAVDLKTITLVVIHDKDVTNSTKEYAASLADDQFADWCKANIKDLEVLPTDDEIAKQVLAGGNFKVPVVIAYTGKKYLWDAPLPKGSMESIQKKLEGK